MPRLLTEWTVAEEGPLANSLRNKGWHRWQVEWQDQGGHVDMASLSAPARLPSDTNL